MDGVPDNLYQADSLNQCSYDHPCAEGYECVYNLNNVVKKSTYFVIPSSCQKKVSDSTSANKSSDLKYFDPSSLATAYDQLQTWRGLQKKTSIDSDSPLCICTYPDEAYADNMASILTTEQKCLKNRGTCQYQIRVSANQSKSNADQTDLLGDDVSQKAPSQLDNFCMNYAGQIICTKL